MFWPLSPVLIGLSVIGVFKMGGNPFFVQERPGKDGRVFKLIKFRTMNNKKDKEQNCFQHIFSSDKA